jgi:hypothetical protein
MKDNLTIISIPVVRIARSALSNLVLDTLIEKGDVVIISPWSDQIDFKKNFKRANTFFIKWNEPELSRFKRKIIDISEIIRLTGYWRKFKNEGMMWFLKHMNIEFGDNGEDIKSGALKYIIYSILSFLGMYRPLWKLVEKIVGKGWYQFPELIDLTKQYNNVTIIQSANWGFQDRSLSRLSEENYWRKVLLTYTTDQLWCNGYLLNNYDAVCVQGDFEFNNAKNFHLIPDESIYELGSAWFRHLEILKEKYEKIHQKSDDSRVVLYAGMGEQYFFRQSEYLALDALIKYFDERPEKIRLIYRPVSSSEDDKRYVRDRYANKIEIQWPDASVIGLNEYPKINQEVTLLDYVGNLKDCELLIMSQNTTISMDAVFLEGCGVISNMIDLDGRLKRRYYSITASACPAPIEADNIDSLISAVEKFLDNPSKLKEASLEMISRWDYPDTDFKAILSKAVFEEY